jgi:hypothetical protein
MMHRRSMLLGLSAALAAPAIVRAESLMKNAKLRRPEPILWHFRNQEFYAGTMHGLVRLPDGEYHTSDAERAQWLTAILGRQQELIDTHYVEITEQARDMALLGLVP